MRPCARRTSSRRSGACLSTLRPPIGRFFSVPRSDLEPRASQPDSTPRTHTTDPPPRSSRSAAEVTSDVHAQNFKLPMVDNVRHRPTSFLTFLGHLPSIVSFSQICFRSRSDPPTVFLAFPPKSTTTSSARSWITSSPTTALRLWRSFSSTASLWRLILARRRARTSRRKR